MRGALACSPLEHTREMLRILESQSIGNLTYILFGGRQTLFRYLGNMEGYQFLRRLAGLLFHHIAEISRGQIHLIGKVSHRWIFRYSARCEILVEFGLENAQKLGVGLAACGELSLVESGEILEKHHDMA